MTSIVVGKNRINILESERYIAGTQNAYKINIVFSEDWSGLDKKIAFKTDCFEVIVDIPSSSDCIYMPKEILSEPTSRLQVGAYGYRDKEIVLSTVWATLGRVVKGAIDTSSCCCGSPSSPSPDAYDKLVELINGKADSLTFENGMFCLWAGDTLLDSFAPPVSLPDGGTVNQVLAKASDADGDFYWRTVNSIGTGDSMSFKVPLGTISIWSGSIDQIPDSYSLCDGQNGTPDLRYAMIVGASDELDPGSILQSSQSSLEKARDISLDSVRYYALAFIQKTSLTEADKKEGQTAYDIAVENGFAGDEKSWLESLKGAKGEDGLDGKSAYEIAVDNNFSGNEKDWLASLKGKDGLSAYQVAQENDFKGSEFEWLESLQGATGEDGKSAYEIAVDNDFVGDESEWLQSLKGEKGDDGYGIPGENGKSAYELAQSTGYQGTLQQWLDSLKGEGIEDFITYTDTEISSMSNFDSITEPTSVHLERCTLSAEDENSIYFNDELVYVVPGDGKVTICRQNGNVITATYGEDKAFATLTEIIFDIDGILQGKNGKSAYEIAKEHGFYGDEEAWLASLKGEPGDNIQRIELFQSASDRIIGRWDDGKPVKRHMKRYTSVTVSSPTSSKLLEAFTTNLVIVRCYAMAKNTTQQFPLPTFLNGVWIDVKYDTLTGDLMLYPQILGESASFQSATFDVTLVLDYVNPNDDVLTDDDLTDDNAPGSESWKTDHRVLTNRDAEEQHPISAIAGLSDLLANTPTKAITSSEINDLFK